MDIRSVTFDTLESDPSFAWLLSAYAEECQISGLPPAQHQPDIYRALEQNGALHLLGAYEGLELVGFASYLVTVLPHYGKPVATTESLFVAPEFRSTGAGIKLIRTMERQALQLGAIGILVSAPVRGQLSKVMPGLNYRHTNEVYFKALA